MLYFNKILIYNVIYFCRNIFEASSGLPGFTDFRTNLNGESLTDQVKEVGFSTFLRGCNPTGPACFRQAGRQLNQSTFGGQR
jgi:hypothetical protein